MRLLAAATLALALAILAAAHAAPPAQAGGDSGAAASAPRALPSVSQRPRPSLTADDPTTGKITWQLTQGVPTALRGYGLTPGDITIGLLTQDAQVPPLIIGHATVSDLIARSELNQGILPSFQIQVTVPLSTPSSYSFPGMYTLFAAPTDALDTPQATLSVCVSQGQGQPSCAFTITTDQNQYHIGDTAQFCYTVPGPGPVTITDSRMAGGGGVIFSAVDDSADGCLSDTLGPPAGPACVIISSPTEVAARAESCFTVQSALADPLAPTP